VALAPGGGLNTQIYLMPADGGEMTLITDGGKTNNWLGDWTDDGRQLTFASNRGGDGSVDGYLYDPATDEARMISDNDGIGFLNDVSPDGSRAVVWRMRSRGNSDLYLIDLASGEERWLTPHEGAAVSGMANFVGNDRILFGSNVDREMIALAEVTIDEAGQVSPLSYVSERDDAELDGLLVDDAFHTAVLSWNRAGRSEMAILDLTTMEATPLAKLPAEIAEATDFSDDGTMLSLTASGSQAPTDVWTVDLSDQEVARITASAHEGVDLASLVAPELVTYEAHDGLELSGWLYRPESSVPAAYVLDFHGGPEGQERPSFNATIQALLTRGIGVFAPNVRGSSGFGKTFVNLDNGILRKDAVRDIKASADYLVDAGIADPDRLGIMGGSYGGYMVMAGLAEFPDLFSAGANLFGVVNFKTFFENTEPWMAAISTVEYGDPETQADMLAELSPINKVDQVTAPTIVLHGANDTNVPVVEAEQVVESLRQRDIPVKYVLFPDEGHGWSKTENRVRSTVEIVNWFATYLLGDAA
jgi:dipeptidyl aminopeptidase/acylaminoacyl peptidase